jgi:hypothetical protein
MLLDDYIPEYEFSERHRVVARASEERCREAMSSWRPADSRLWRWLLRLRGLGRPDGTLRDWAESNGFLLLGETPDEVAYGQIGRFWALNERGALVSPHTIAEFRAFDRPGYAVAVMNVRIKALGDSRSQISTETRIRTIGAGARWRFRLYWLLIRPFSGVLRRAMLNGMSHRAEINQRGKTARELNPRRRGASAPRDEAHRP